MSAVSKLCADIASCHDLQNSPGKSSLLNTPMAFPFRDDFITSKSFVKFPLSLSFCEHHTHAKRHVWTWIKWTFTMDCTAKRIEPSKIHSPDHEQATWLQVHFHDFPWHHDFRLVLGTRFSFCWTESIPYHGWIHKSYHSIHIQIANSMCSYEKWKKYNAIITTDRLKPHWAYTNYEFHHRNLFLFWLFWIFN